MALRLNQNGTLRLCMDRPDLSLHLVPLLRRHGPKAVKKAWKNFLEQEAA